MKAMGDLCYLLAIKKLIIRTNELTNIHAHEHTCNLQFTRGALAIVLCSLIISFLSQTGWLAPSPWTVGGPMVMNVFPFL